MSRDFTNSFTNRLSAATPAFTIEPYGMMVWAQTDETAANDFWLAVGDKDFTNQAHGIGGFQDGTGVLHGALYRNTGGSSAITLTTTTYTGGTTDWLCVIGGSSAGNDGSVWLNGAGKATNTQSRAIVAPDSTAIGGPLNAGSGFNADARIAHAAIWNRKPTDIEAAFLGTGGNPRFVSGLTHYWHVTGTDSPELDSVGTLNLTVTGTLSAGASDPVIGSYFTGATVSDKVWTQSSAIVDVTVDARFEDVASAFTTSWKVLSSPASTTTASAAGTASQELTVASAASISVGDYVSITNNSTPTLVLMKSGSTLFLATPRTWANGATVYKFTISNASIAGLSLAGGVITGTPTGTLAATPYYFFRATNNTTATLIADSNVFSITVNAAAAAPQFSSSPAVTATTNDGYTVRILANQSATVHVVALTKGSAAPNAADVIAHTGALAFATKSVTTAQDSVTLTGLDFPVHDLYAALTNANGNSSVFALTNEVKSPPAGKVYLTFASVDADTIYASFTPAVVAGDIREADATLTPSGETPIDGADGSVEYLSDGRQSRVERIYDVSAGAFMVFGAGDTYTQFWNALPPAFIDPIETPYEIPARIGIAISSFDYTSAIQSPHGDTLTYAVTGSLPSGLSVGSNTETGTPTTAGITRYTVQATDDAGLTLDLDVVRVVRPARPTVTNSIPDVTVTVGKAPSAIAIATAFSHDSGDSMTFALKQLDGARGAVTAAIASGDTGATALQVSDASAVHVGDYLGPATVLAIYSNEIELNKPMRWDAGDSFTLASASTVSNGTLAVTDGFLTGSALLLGTSSAFVRATDSDGDIADSDFFLLQVGASTTPTPTPTPTPTGTTFRHRRATNLRNFLLG